MTCNDFLFCVFFAVQLHTHTHLETQSDLMLMIYVIFIAFEDEDKKTRAPTICNACEYILMGRK